MSGISKWAAGALCGQTLGQSHWNLPRTFSSHIPSQQLSVLLELLLPISAAVNEDNGFGNLRESVMGESLDSVEGTGAHPE